MYISAQTDYGVRALIALAAAPSGKPVKGEQLARSENIPAKFLENILGELRRAGMVSSQRGADGGYRLAREPSDISVADVMRALEGPLAEVRGLRPEALVYEGTAVHLQDVWVAVRASLRAVLERVTLAHLVNGTLPAAVRKMAEDPDAWLPH